MESLLWFFGLLGVPTAVICPSLPKPVWDYQYISTCLLFKIVIGSFKEYVGFFMNLHAIDSHPCIAVT